MQSFFSNLTAPGDWNQTQWLAVLIGLFVLFASFYFIWKLYDIIRNAGKSTYRPNIGRARLNSRSAHGPRPGPGGEGPRSAGQEPGRQDGPHEKDGKDR